jgi:polyhydroxybutyrate depolymerase
VDGLKRSYLVHVPPSYNRSRSFPLLLAFHGGGGTGRNQQKLSNLDEVADANGFVVVYPNGYGRSWNSGHGVGRAEKRGVDDVRFVSNLIDRLAKDYAIDKRRVYATGMSQGALFVHRLACELSDRITAVAPVSGSMPVITGERCRPRRPVPILIFHGEKDRISPYRGGRTLTGGQTESIEQTVDEWARRNGCRLTPKRETLSEEVSTETYDVCREGANVRLYRFATAGHTWPGGPQYLPRIMIGKTATEVNASEVMWKFFSRYSLP